MLNYHACACVSIDYAHEQKGQSGLRLSGDQMGQTARERQALLTWSVETVTFSSLSHRHRERGPLETGLNP